VREVHGTAAAAVVVGIRCTPPVVAGRVEGTVDPLAAGKWAEIDLSKSAEKN